MGNRLCGCLQLRAEVDEGTLGALKAAVDAIKEPQFQYDKTYVYDSMEWGLPPSSPSTPGVETSKRCRLRERLALSLSSAARMYW